MSIILTPTFWIKNSITVPVKSADHQDSQVQVSCWSCRHLQCVCTAGGEDSQVLPRDWQRPWQTQVGQTAQDNCSRRQLAVPTVKSQAHVNCLTAPGGVDASDTCFVKNCMSDSCSQWSPRSYCCPETSAKQETAKKPCCIRQGPQPDGRLDSRKVAKIFSDESSVTLHPKHRQYCRRPSGARLDPWFTQKNTQIWKDYGSGLHPIRRFQGDL